MKCLAFSVHLPSSIPERESVIIHSMWSQGGILAHMCSVKARPSRRISKDVRPARVTSAARVRILPLHPPVARRCSVDIRAVFAPNDFRKRFSTSLQPLSPQTDLGPLGQRLGQRPNNISAHRRPQRHHRAILHIHQPQLRLLLRPVRPSRVRIQDLEAAGNTMQVKHISWMENHSQSSLYWDMVNAQTGAKMLAGWSYAKYDDNGKLERVADFW